MNMDLQATRHWVVDLCGHSVKYYLPNRRGIEEKCTRESPAYRQSRDSTQKYASFLHRRRCDMFVKVANPCSLWLGRRNLISSGSGCLNFNTDWRVVFSFFFSLPFFPVPGIFEGINPFVTSAEYIYGIYWHNWGNRILNSTL